MCLDVSVTEGLLEHLETKNAGRDIGGSLQWKNAKDCTQRWNFVCHLWAQSLAVVLRASWEHVQVLERGKG